LLMFDCPVEVDSSLLSVQQQFETAQPCQTDYYFATSGGLWASKDICAPEGTRVPVRNGFDTLMIEMHYQPKLYQLTAWPRVTIYYESYKSGSFPETEVSLGNIGIAKMGSAPKGPLGGNLIAASAEYSTVSASGLYRGPDLEILGAEMHMHMRGTFETLTYVDKNGEAGAIQPCVRNDPMSPRGWHYLDYLGEPAIMPQGSNLTMSCVFAPSDAAQLEMCNFIFFYRGLPVESSSLKLNLNGSFSAGNPCL